MSPIAGNIILGIPEDREKHYQEQIKAMNLLDKILFTELVRTDQDAALSVLRVLMNKPDLEYAVRPRENRTFTLPVKKDDVLFFSLQSGNKKIEALLDFEDEEKEELRARAYSSALDVSIAKEYGLTSDSSDEEFLSSPDSYVIFLMKQDLFRHGRPVYRIERCYSGADNEEMISADDGSHILYVNGAYSGDDALGTLMCDFRCSNPEEMRTEFLCKAVMTIRNSDESLFVMEQMLEREYLKSKRLDRKLRVYRINPTCPFCSEEHVSYDITLTDQEQKRLDDAYESPDLKGKTDMEQLIRTMYHAPVYVRRRVHCICGRSYEAEVGVTRQDEIVKQKSDGECE